VKDIPSILKSKIGEIQALNPVAGETLAQDLARLRAAANAAISVQRDPALAQAKEQLRARVDEDGRARQDGKTTFSCPDPSIRNQAEATAKRIEEIGKIVMPDIEVPDMTEITESLKIFGALLDSKKWGQPGGLSISDFAILLFAAALELIMTGTAGSFAFSLTEDSAIDRLPRDMDRDPRLALSIVRAFAGDPDPYVRQVMTMIERHEMRLFGYRRLVVLYGSDDASSQKLAWNASIMRDLDMIDEDSFLLASLRLSAAVALWRQGKRYDRMEIFRVKDRAFDKIRAREFIARVREDLDGPHTPSPVPQDNTPWRQAAE